MSQQTSHYSPRIDNQNTISATVVGGGYSPPIASVARTLDMRMASSITGGGAGGLSSSPPPYMVPNMFHSPPPLQHLGSRAQQHHNGVGGGDTMDENGDHVMSIPYDRLQQILYDDASAKALRRQRHASPNSQQQFVPAAAVGMGVASPRHADGADDDEDGSPVMLGRTSASFPLGSQQHQQQATASVPQGNGRERTMTPTGARGLFSPPQPSSSSGSVSPPFPSAANGMQQPTPQQSVGRRQRTPERGTSPQGGRGAGGASAGRQQHQSRLGNQRSGSTASTTTTNTPRAAGNRSRPQSASSTGRGNSAQAGRSPAATAMFGGAASIGRPTTPGRGGNAAKGNSNGTPSEIVGAQSPAGAVRECRRLKSFIRIRPLIPNEVAMHQQMVKERQQFALDNPHHHSHHSGQSPHGNGVGMRSSSPHRSPSSAAAALADGGIDIPPLSCVAVGDDGQSIRIAEDAPCTLDGVFAPDSEPSALFEAVVTPNITDAFNGHHTSVLLYGQTGSGKSFTMQELLPAFVDGLFELAENSAAQFETTVTVEAQQIYLESISDLLAPESTDLQIREFPDTGIYVRGAKEVTVASAEEFHDLWREAVANRAVASTKINHFSSRSHCIVTFSIKRRRRVTREQFSALNSANNSTNVTVTGSPHRLSGGGRADTSAISNPNASLTMSSSVSGGVAITTCGKVSFADLAGSERLKKSGSEGTRRHEAIAINQSLSTLGNVMQALADTRATHIPFRDSKLTRLLQESLAGGGSSCLITTISPYVGNYHESKSSLAFAMRAMKVIQAVTTWREIDGKTRMMETQDWLENRVHILEERLRAMELARRQQELTERRGGGGGEGGDSEFEETPDGEAARSPNGGGRNSIHSAASPLQLAECTNCPIANNRIMELENDLAMLQRDHSALQSKCDIKVQNLQQSLEYALEETSSLRRKVAEAEAIIAGNVAMPSSKGADGGGGDTTDASFGGGGGYATDSAVEDGESSAGGGGINRLFDAANTALNNNPIHQRRMNDLKAYYEGYVESIQSHLSEATAERDAASEEVVALSKELTMMRVEMKELLEAAEAELAGEQEINEALRREMESVRRSAASAVVPIAAGPPPATIMTTASAAVQTTNASELVVDARQQPHLNSSVAAAESARLEQLLNEKIDEVAAFTTIVAQLTAENKGLKAQHADVTRALEDDVAAAQQRLNEVREDSELQLEELREALSLEYEEQREVVEKELAAVRAELEELAAEQAATAEGTASLANDNANLRRDITSLRKELADAASSLAQAKDTYSAQLATLSAEASTLSSDLNKATIVNASLNAQLEAFKGTARHDADAAVNSLQSLTIAHTEEMLRAEERHQHHLAEARRVNEALLEQLKEARDEVNIVSEEHSIKNTQLQTEVARLGQQVRSLSAEKAELSAQLAAEISAAEEAVAAGTRFAEARAERLNGDIQQLKQSMVDKAEAYEKELSNLREERDVALRNLQSAGEATNVNAGVVKSLEEKLANTLTILQQRNGEVERLGEEKRSLAEQLEEELAAANGRLAAKEKDVVGLRSDVFKLQQALHDADEKTLAVGGEAQEKLAAALKASVEEAKAQSQRMIALQLQHDEEVAELEARQQEHVATAQREMDDLRGQLRAAKKEAADQRLAIQQGHNDSIGRHEAEVLDLNRRLTQLQKELARANTNILVLEGRVEDADGERSHAQQQLAEAVKKASAEAQTAAQRLVDAEAAHKVATTSLEETYAARIEALSAKVEQLGREKAAALRQQEDVLSEAEGAAEGTAAELRDLTSTKQRLERSVQSLTAALATEKQRCAEIQGALDTHHAQQSALSLAHQQELADLARRHDAVAKRCHEEMAKFAHDLEAMEEQKETAEARLAAANAAAVDLKREMGALKSRLRDAEASVEAEAASVTAANDTERNRYSMEVAALQKKLGTVNAALIAKENIIHQLEADLDATRTAASDAQQAHMQQSSEANKRVAAMERAHQQQVKQLRDEFVLKMAEAQDELEAQRTNLQGTIHTMRLEAKRKAVELSDVEARLASATEDLSTAQKALNDARQQQALSNAAAAALPTHRAVPYLSSSVNTSIATARDEHHHQQHAANAANAAATIASLTSENRVLREQVHTLKSNLKAAEADHSLAVSTTSRNAEEHLRGTVAELKRQHANGEEQLRRAHREAVDILSEEHLTVLSRLRIELEEHKKDSRHHKAEAHRLEALLEDCRMVLARTERDSRAEISTLREKLLESQRDHQQEIHKQQQLFRSASSGTPQSPSVEEKERENRLFYERLAEDRAATAIAALQRDNAAALEALSDRLACEKVAEMARLNAAHQHKLAQLEESSEATLREVRRGLTAEKLAVEQKFKLLSIEHESLAARSANATAAEKALCDRIEALRGEHAHALSTAMATAKAESDAIHRPLVDALRQQLASSQEQCVALARDVSLARQASRELAVRLKVVEEVGGDATPAGSIAMGGNSPNSRSTASVEIEAIRKSYERQLATRDEQSKQATEALNYAHASQLAVLEERFAAFTKQLADQQAQHSTALSEHIAEKAVLEVKVTALTTSLHEASQHIARLREQSNAYERKAAETSSEHSRSLEAAAQKLLAAEERHRKQLADVTNSMAAEVSDAQAREQLVAEEHKSMSESLEARLATEKRAHQRSLDTLKAQLASRCAEVDRITDELSDAKAQSAAAAERHMKELHGVKQALSGREQQVSLLKAQLHVFEETTLSLTNGLAAGGGMTDSDGGNSSANSSSHLSHASVDNAATAIRRFAEEARANGLRLQQLRDAHDVQLSEVHQSHQLVLAQLHTECDKLRANATKDRAEVLGLREEVKSLQEAKEDDLYALRCELSAKEQQVESTRDLAAKFRVALATAERDTKAAAHAEAKRHAFALSLLEEQLVGLKARLRDQSAAHEEAMGALKASHEASVQSLSADNKALRRDAVARETALVGHQGSATATRDSHAHRVHGYSIQLAAAKALVADSKRQMEQLRRELAYERSRHLGLAESLEGLVTAPNAAVAPQPQTQAVVQTVPTATVAPRVMTEALLGEGSSVVSSVPPLDDSGEVREGIQTMLKRLSAPSEQAGGEGEARGKRTRALTPPSAPSPQGGVGHQSRRAAPADTTCLAVPRTLIACGGRQGVKGGGGDRLLRGTTTGRASGRAGQQTSATTVPITHTDTAAPLALVAETRRLRSATAPSMGRNPHLPFSAGNDVGGVEGHRPARLDAALESMSGAVGVTKRYWLERLWDRSTNARSGGGSGLDRTGGGAVIRRTGSPLVAAAPLVGSTVWRGQSDGHGRRRALSHADVGRHHETFDVYSTTMDGCHQCPIHGVWSATRTTGPPLAGFGGAGVGSHHCPMHAASCAAVSTAGNSVLY